ncbi:MULTISPECIES: GH92 family glycosyl hydrolase [Chitinophagaceae]
MRKKSFFLLAGLTACCFQTKAQLVQYINPMIGTARMGHTYPGATVPFGSVQLSPDTDTIPHNVNGQYQKNVYEYCAGYQYDDKTIVGFSHTHFNGVGHSDLGDLLMMPTTGRLQLNPGTADNPDGGFRSRFSHTTEKASANYYSVLLEDDHIQAELTTTTRVGVHRYTFPKSNDAHIILDMIYNIYNYEGKNVWSYVRVLNDSTVVGYRQTNGWARNRTVYFALKFSKPFKQYGYKNFSKNETYAGFWRKMDIYHNFPEMSGHDLRLYFDFNTDEGEAIVSKMALSPVSWDNAVQNMQAEAPGWDFDAIKKQGQDAWEKELEKVQIKTATEEQKINFYTAMYHAFINPTVYTDVNGQYKGNDQQVHQAKGFTNYSTFSLWDTYRAEHPLLALLQTKRANDMIQSMLAHYDQSSIGMLPIWSHYANDNWCMSGYHAVTVLADAVVKGINTFDAGEALDACLKTSNNPYWDNIPTYKQMGFIPDEKSGTSVSTTLEYAFDDWSIAQMAKKLGRDDIYQEYLKRSQSYKRVFDPSIGFMRPKSAAGIFRKNFDVLETDGEGFIEGNSWNFSFFVPQDPKALIQMMGGEKRFIQRLDSLFTMELPDKYFEHTEDITRDGLIGNYVHGNEPSHHVPYLYNYTSQPWKTQERVRMILKSQYHNGQAGLGGNDDCGQMSAWYIFSSLGFYPIAPGSDVYAVGSPAVEDAVLKFENGKQLHIIAKSQSDKNVYIKKITLNGKVLKEPFLHHKDLIGGGTLEFEMTGKPQR